MSDAADALYGKEAALELFDGATDRLLAVSLEADVAAQAVLGLPDGGPRLLEYLCVFFCQTRSRVFLV
jgi:hypothetical protein